MDSTFVSCRRDARSAAVVLCSMAAIGVVVSLGRAEDARPAKSWRVEGRVLDDQGQPAAGVDVFTNDLAFLPSAQKSSAKTDRDGRFVLEVAHRVNGRLIRASRDDGRQQASTQLAYEIEKESKVPPLVLKLQPAREIVATVVDADGRSVAGAKVMVTASYEQLTATATDKNGRAALRVPADLELQYVIAAKPAVGLDYWAFRRPGETKSDPYKLAADYSGELKFVLNGTRAVTVRVIGENDQPLANVRVYPWLLQKPGKGSENDQLNLGGLGEFTRMTDDQGVASFDNIPSDNTKRINFWANAEGYYSPERHMFDPASDNSELLAKLVPLVSVTGHCTLADGRPASDIEVIASGAGYGMDGFYQSTRTDSAGDFKFQAYPDQFYVFAAGNRDAISPPLYQIVRSGTPVEGLKLVLQQAIRIHGQVTSGRQHAPMKGTYVRLCPKLTRAYYELPEDQRLPNPENSSTGIYPRIVRNTKADESGHFEFFACPGSYYVMGPRNIEPTNIEVVAGQKVVEVNLHAERPETVPVTGRVVLRDKPAQGVPEARVNGEATDSFGRRGIDAVSGADGRFQAERSPSNAVVFAATSDGKLAGVVTIGPNNAEVTIPIGPTASAHGRLLDEESGEPIADRQIDYGIHVQYSDKTFGTRFGGSVHTDANGEFTTPRLVVGQKTEFNAAIETGGDGRPRSWHTVATASPVTAEMVELGDVKLPRPYRPPTTQEKVAKAFADNRTLKERVESRLRDTGHSYQRVLLVIGDPASPLIQRFYELEYDKDLDGAAYNYQFVPVNTTDTEHTKPMQDYLVEIGITWPNKDESVLAVLDEKGAVAGQAALQELLTDQTVDPIKLAAFLNALAPELPDAEALMADALAQAKREDKRVFVQVSGPRCGWCFVLSRFLDAHHELIDKEFVYVKLDDRLKNGEALIKRVRPKQEGGIPWMVFLDEKGDSLITSDGPEGNIGYPGEPEGRVQFEKMLRTGTKNLTDDEIKALIAALEKDKY